MTNKLIGYMRVSTDKKPKNGETVRPERIQTFDLQEDALIAAGVEKSDIYSDKVSGRKTSRPGLDECLRTLRKGDTLIVWRLDRLGRDALHLIKTIVEMNKKGIEFKTLTGVQIDTTAPVIGKFTLHLFAALAEMEADQTRERVMAGLEAARARGRFGGRPSALTANQLRYAQVAMQNRDTSVVKLCKELGLKSKSTLYKYVTPEGQLTEFGEKILKKAA